MFSLLQIIYTSFVFLSASFVSWKSGTCVKTVHWFSGPFDGRTFLETLCKIWLHIHCTFTSRLTLCNPISFFLNSSLACKRNHTHTGKATLILKYPFNCDDRVSPNAIGGWGGGGEVCVGGGGWGEGEGVTCVFDCKCLVTIFYMKIYGESKNASLTSVKVVLLLQIWQFRRVPSNITVAILERHLFDEYLFWGCNWDNACSKYCEWW